MDIEEKTFSCCEGKKKVRDEKEYKALISRLNRIEGQIRGLKKMLENDAYCPDILIQASAVSAAIQSFSRKLLYEHIETCVADGIREGNNDVIDELILTLQKMMK